MNVSVVIPCHAMSGWRDLVRAVDSVFVQSTTPAEVVVAVDHNPELFARASRAFPDAVVVANGYARGASGNRNTGVEHTSAPIVAMLDGDSYARPGWLTDLVQPFEYPSVVGTGGAIVPRWHAERPAWFPDEFLWTVGGSFPSASPEPAPTRNVWSASMAVRRDAFDAVGGFRVGFGKQGNMARPEDTELCLRLAEASGGHWMYVPSAQIEHPVEAERATFAAFMSRCYAEGRGKVAMARLLTGPALDSERSYLSRTIPRAVGKGIAATAKGQGMRHMATAGATLMGIAAAGIGGGVEAIRTPRDHDRAPAPLPLTPMTGRRATASARTIEGGVTAGRDTVVPIETTVGEHTEAPVAAR